MRKERYCRNCGEPFIPSKRQIFCSLKCKNQYYWRKKNPIKEIICEYCNTPFKPKSLKQLYCSEDCAIEMNRIKAKKLRFKLKCEFPELYFNKLGSKGTSTNYKLYRTKDGEPDFEKELVWVKREKKRLGLNEKRRD